VQLPRTVDAETDEEPVRCEELSPLVVQQRAVGLDRVLDPYARTLDTLGQLDSAAEEVETHQRGLATLPGDRHLIGLVSVEQLGDVRLEHLVAHPEPVAGVQRLLHQEEAVLAVEIADRAGRLREHVELGGDRCS
jgi:hypothetical protein